MDEETPRPRRRVSFGLTRRLQVMVTPDTAKDVQALADLRKESEGEVIRASLAEYVPGALKRAKWSSAKAAAV